MFGNLAPEQVAEFMESALSPADKRVVADTLNQIAEPEYPPLFEVVAKVAQATPDIPRCLRRQISAVPWRRVPRPPRQLR